MSKLNEQNPLSRRVDSHSLTCRHKRIQYWFIVLCVFVLSLVRFQNGRKKTIGTNFDIEHVCSKRKKNQQKHWNFFHDEILSIARKKTIIRIAANIKFIKIFMIRTQTDTIFIQNYNIYMYKVLQYWCNTKYTRHACAIYKCSTRISSFRKFCVKYRTETLPTMIRFPPIYFIFCIWIQVNTVAW